MNEKVHYSYHLEAAAAAEGFVTIVTVPSGQILTIQKVEIMFPAGTEDELHLAIYYGNQKMLPKEGTFRGDSVRLEKSVELKYHSEEKVILYYKNENTTYARIADIIIEGVLE